MLLGAALAVTGATGAAASTALPPDGTSDGVRVTVEIRDRVSPHVVVVGEGPFVAGEQLVVRGGDLPSNAVLEVWLHSDPQLLAGVTTDADGDFELTTTLPADTAPGEHRIRAVAPALGVEVASEPFEVVAAPGAGGPADPDDPAVPADGTPGGGGASASPRPGGLATTGAGLAGAAVVAALAVATGVALRRRAVRGA